MALTEPDPIAATRVVACRSCDADIRWVRTRGGKNMPVDAHPIRVFAGTSVTEDSRPVVKTAVGYQSHFATCPNADQHRRPR